MDSLHLSHVSRKFSTVTKTCGAKNLCPLVENPGWFPLQLITESHRVLQLGKGRFQMDVWSTALATVHFQNCGTNSRKMGPWSHISQLEPSSLEHLFKVDKYTMASTWKYVINPYKTKVLIKVSPLQEYMEEVVFGLIVCLFGWFGFGLGGCILFCFCIEAVGGGKKGRESRRREIVFNIEDS